jgi:hypothetical protein
MPQRPGMSTMGKIGMGGAGAAALWPLVEYLAGKDTAPLAADADQPQPSVSPIPLEEVQVNGKADFATTAKKALGKFKRISSGGDGGTSPVVPVPTPKASSDKMDGRVDAREKERADISEEIGMGADTFQGRYQRELQKRKYKPY